MSARRPRDVARMLARREPAEPPPGLLEKIKGEIPEVLPRRAAGPGQVVPIASRRRLRTGWIVAAAASLAAAIGAGFLAVRVSQEVPTLEKVAAEPEPAPGRADLQPRPQAPPAPLVPPPAAENLHAEPAPEFEESSKVKDELARPAEVGRAAEPVQPEEIPEVDLKGEAGSVPGGVHGGTPGGVVSEPEAQDAPLRVPQEAELKRQVEQPAAKPAPAPRAAAPALSDAGAVKPDREAGAEGRLRSMVANDAETGSYAAVRRSLAAGRLPPANAVRVAEMVDFFDYGDPPPAHGDFAIRIEGAPTPFAPGDRWRLLRINLRGREARVEDPKVEVELNPQVVARHRSLGYDGSVAAARIAAGHGVTLLYEIELQPGASPREDLVTVRLRYRSVDTGRAAKTERSTRLSGLAPSWQTASPALRLASVVAELAETLKGTKSGDLDRLAGLAGSVAAEFTGRDRAGDVAEFAALVEKARSMK